MPPTVEESQKNGFKAYIIGIGVQNQTTLMTVADNTTTIAPS
jgi:hypothetical protein